MRILHTADWHIGQLFFEYDRHAEHQAFLQWLLRTLSEEAIDVLLISGDVFDLSNPSAAAIRLFYSFLRDAIGANNALQIVVIAGNHDSASRLEAPKPLLEASGVHIIGWVEKDATGRIDYEKLLIPLHDASGETRAWCLAIPFLRNGDYPAVADSPQPYADGVHQVYQEAYAYAAQRRQPDQAIIAMGHLHARHAEISDLDNSERLIMGGVECISAAAFDENLAYVALGHIHKAQSLGGKAHIRYSGSPIPLSFSERQYTHQVVVFDLEQEANAIQMLAVPLFVPLLTIPAQHGPVSEVIRLIEALPAVGKTKPELAPKDRPPHAGTRAPETDRSVETQTGASAQAPETQMDAETRAGTDPGAETQPSAAAKAETDAVPDMETSPGAASSADARPGTDQGAETQMDAGTRAGTSAQAPDTDRSAETCPAIDAPTGAAADANTAPPYLEVRVLLDAPDPALRHKIQSALEGKHVRLAKIDIRYGGEDKSSPAGLSSEQLDNLSPADVFSSAYSARYGDAVPTPTMTLFRQVLNEVMQEADA